MTGAPQRSDEHTSEALGSLAARVVRMTEAEVAVWAAGNPRQVIAMAASLLTQRPARKRKADQATPPPDRGCARGLTV